MSGNLYKRGDTWWARFKVAGVEYRRSLRTRVRAEAERRLKAERSAIEDQVRFGIKGPTSWQAAVIGWHQQAAAEVSASTLKRYLVSLKQLRPFLDDKMLHQINMDLLRDVTRGRRIAGATNATIRRDLTAMSSVVEYCIDEGWLDSNPTLAFRTKRVREKHVPIVLPQDAAMAIVLDASPTRFRDAQEFARETGMRQEEIFSLRRHQLDARGGTITIYGKGNKLRVVPYSRAARTIVDRQPPFLGSDFVFWHSSGDRWASPGARFRAITRGVAQKAARAGTPFEVYRFHDLRHLFAVEFLRRGEGGIYELQGRLGHSSIKTTERYLAFLTPAERKRAIETVAQTAAQRKRFEEGRTA